MATQTPATPEIKSDSGPGPAFPKILTSCTDPGPKEKRRILPELTPVIRIRSHLWYSPELNTIRFPDRDPTGFCNSEPDLDWIGFRKNSTGSDMDIRTALITACLMLTQSFFSDINRIGSNIWTGLPD